MTRAAEASALLISPKVPQKLSKSGSSPTFSSAVPIMQPDPSNSHAAKMSTKSSDTTTFRIQPRSNSQMSCTQILRAQSLPASIYWVCKVPAPLVLALSFPFLITQIALLQSKPFAAKFVRSKVTSMPFCNSSPGAPSL